MKTLKRCLKVNLTNIKNDSLLKKEWIEFQVEVALIKSVSLSASPYLKLEKNMKYKLFIEIIYSVFTF